MLRKRLCDPVHEVGWAAWGMLMEHPDELPNLIAELTENPDPEQLWYRLASFEETRARSPDVINATLELMTDENPKVRAATIVAVGRWDAPEPALIHRIRIAMDDPSPDVRKIAASFLKRHADAASDH
jgi:HEAT repeat protein